MLHHRYFKSVSLIVFLLLASCATPTTTPSNSNLQVNPPTSQSPKPVAETIRMNNCGGKADAKQTAERFYAVTVEGELSIGVSAEVVKAQVGAKYVSSSGTSKKQELIAPAGTNMEFILLWTEDVKTGTVTVEGKSGQATYQVKTPVSVELQSSKDLGCGGQPNTQPTPTPIPPTLTSTKVPPALQPTAVPISPSATIQPTSNVPQGNNLKSRSEMLVTYNSIYNQQGWCSLWTKLSEDNLVKGNCPTLVLQWGREDIDTSNGKVNLLTGLQMRLVGNLEVRYPTCVTFGEAKYTGGIVKPWIHNDFIATNLTMQNDSVFSLFFRCDNAWSP